MIKYVLVAILFVSGCSPDKHSKKKHVSTINICLGVFLESYSVYGSGAFGGDLYSYYLTDSSNFRIYIDTYDTYSEGISAGCSGDTVYVLKYVDKETKPKISYRKTYSKSELIKKNIKQ
ncbi:hypothetical protein CAP35_01320 [Chitinophagaceae bacterium IBVUCB1]|nr:hypothetical protein CAP35_01320 [Chitinophagaceae bacterium IBVUCB1]